MIDHTNTIRKLESATIRAAIRQFIISAFALYVLFSGEVIDQSMVDKWANYLSIGGMIAYQLWETRNITKARIRADEKVDPSTTWKEEIAETKPFQAVANLVKGKTE